MSRGKLFIFLVGLAALVFLGSSAFAACVTPTGGQVIVWHAGGLIPAFDTATTGVEAEFLCQTGIQVVHQRAGSLDIVRQVTAGGQAADIVAPADYLDIDLFLKARDYADYDIRFAETKMVLAYCLGAGAVCGGQSKPIVSGAGPNGAIADPNGTFAPTVSNPDAIPNAVANWYQLLLTPGVLVGGSHLYLDPSGYRAPMIFRLAQSFYNVPNLYDNLLEHYIATPATTPSGPYKLGLNYDYQFTYENNAFANVALDLNYRYVNLPDNINLGNSAKNGYYRKAVIVEPDLFGTGFVPLPASRVVFGITVLKNAPNKDNAIEFVKFLLGPDGQNALQTYGPAPIIPAEVTREDYRKLPAALKPLVTVTCEDD